ncbi:MAG: Glu-tRNA(Gln) amidotransferase subunit GatE [Candidatus Thermoplasmatota archaeon]
MADLSVSLVPRSPFVSSVLRVSVVPGAVRGEWMTLDYAALGFKAGLEIHQQLDTRKLFCRCPSRLDETEAADVTFLRALKPTASELGEVDRSAVEEARKSLIFEYVGSRDSTCLVEMDEEPPHSITPEALDVALQVALLLKTRPVAELHIMRKIVVDGSNTGGFQRTALLATDGVVEAEGGASRIATLCLEEDSARRLDRVGNLQRYRLDRLGIPLVEIATEPDLKGPQHAREVAEAIGMALRATGRVKRGIGTIRQDLNVSIREGARVEIKGVQELRLIAPAVEWEVARQIHLLDIKKKLLERGAKLSDYAARPIIDVSDVFTLTEAKMVKGHTVFAVALPHLAGLIGKKGPNEGKDAAPPPRVGRELADYAKQKAGVKGIFHSDELPAYGITEAEVEAVHARLSLGGDDAFALVVEKKAVAEVALHGVLSRAAMLLEGVPEETRDLNADATSRYLRPLPGGARMYPETDVPPVTLTEERLRALSSALPEMPAQKLARFARQYPDLSAEQAKQLVRSGEAAIFERLVAASGLPREAARVLINVPADITEPGQPPRDIPEDVAMDALSALKEGAFAKEALPQVVKHVLVHHVSARDAAKALGLGGVSEDEVIRAIDAVIEEKRDIVDRQKERAAGAIMGPIMAKYRGRFSGDAISKLVQDRLRKKLS